MSKRLIRRIALLAVLAATVLGAGYSLWPSVAPRHLTITAQFDNTIGLYTGNIVAVLGMPVGRVGSISPKNDYVEVVLDVDAKVQIPSDVTAVTVGTSILTDRHVELTPPYRGGPTLADGAVLSLRRTRTPIEFDRVLKMLDKLGTAMHGDGAGGGPMADILNATSDITSTSGERIKSALGALSAALRTGDDGGQATRQNLTTVVTNLSRLTDSAAQNEALVREFGSNIRQLSDILAEENVGRGQTGRRLNQVLEQLNRLLGDNGENLAATLQSSNDFTKALVDYRRELAEVFDVAPLAIDNVAAAIDPDNGMLRVGAHFDSVFFDSSMTKEVCNILGLRQLGCRTGTIRDLGPDFGLTSVLEAMTRLGK
ncbi:mammalian cell entry protein [Mycobacterium intermedium]|uniref:Mammalian cell entry protein n=1 Tax=Mycobacterium intermedium TaxID=28445 RepID=A0A1E3SL65_MYCIE|nr:MCE family protein [Mycobacterium intermedium]MCV6963484.1 MCE family protein [Mycobacterium intermedium]ODR02861.1 mammalian cell entry protein [Mycobacterium intermedium]OPE49911.1 mammalian cell entry protein [Mycobacterium intermedium]ORB02762.1 mammalian cell entry protein [Mycobacterium intermedium]